MARIYRPLVGVNEKTGEVKRWESSYQCCRELGVALPSVTQALDRGGAVKGWRVFDTPESIDQRIAVLEERKAEVRRLLGEDEE